MKERIYLYISGVFFLVIATLHLLRLAAGWEMRLAGLAVPVWMSVPGLIFTGVMAVWGILLAVRTRSGTGM
jgi:hypothetical protein